MRHRVTLLPGDGIGPEVVEATLLVLEATGVALDWDRHDKVGAAALEAYGTPLPEHVLTSIRDNKVALKGPITTPVETGFRSVNVALRQRLDLYANVRPCLSLPGIKTPFENVDLIIFRENTEGLYSGIENYDARLEIADSIARITRTGSQRIIRFCFDYARRQGRKSVTLVHKANILKETSGMFLRLGREIAEDYPDVEFNDRIIDNMCMQLVMYPERYDCIVTTNLFGDILSDLAAGLVGGLGVVSGANIGDECAVFEAVHGSAPDIAGLGKANPTALIRTAEMMLRHLGEMDAADALGQALYDTYAAGEYLTGDVGGRSSTMEFAGHLAEKVASLLAL
ncbi:MAG: isocitrate/isopropylmalate dehydrogenase family protein [Rhodothermales bacterium]